jgi:hypothetical protein
MPRSQKTVFSIYKASQPMPYNAYTFVGSFSSMRKALKWKSKNPTECIRYNIQIVEEEKPSFKVGEYVAVGNPNLSPDLIHGYLTKTQINKINKENRSI